MANSNHRYTPSILLIIRSAHWTALAINDSVLGLGRDSCRSSGFFRCRATKIPATMAKTRFRPSSIWIMLAYSLFIRYLPKTPVVSQFEIAGTGGMVAIHAVHYNFAR